MLRTLQHDWDRACIFVWLGKISGNVSEVSRLMESWIFSELVKMDVGSAVWKKGV